MFYRFRDLDRAGYERFIKPEKTSQISRELALKNLILYRSIPGREPPRGRGFLSGRTRQIVIPIEFYRKGGTEGFGLAPAEAIVRGIPAIAPDREVFREPVELYNCSDRARFFSATDADALADRLEPFIREPIPRLRSEDIPAKSNRRTWENIARESIAILPENAR